MRQDKKLALTVAAKTYLQRLSIIWTSLMSDVNRVKATNQFALPVLTYPMWTQHWPLGEPQSIDRETRKLTSENDHKCPVLATRSLLSFFILNSTLLRGVEVWKSLTK